jgi:hypothetical protein
VPEQQHQQQPAVPEPATAGPPASDPLAPPAGADGTATPPATATPGEWIASVYLYRFGKICCLASGIVFCFMIQEVASLPGLPLLFLRHTMSSNLTYLYTL